MRFQPGALWGCGQGPVTRLAPPTRLIAGLACFTAIIVAPVLEPAGLVLVAAVCLFWGLGSRPPARVLGAFLLLGLGLFLPYFLLAPFIPSPSGEAGWTSLRPPASVLVHGLAGILVTVSTASALGLRELREALHRLPIPRDACAIVLQIVQQASVLAEETRRIASVLSLRGATGRRRSLSVAGALPQVWLPRVLARAERVAAAMAVRGYTGSCAGGVGQHPLRLYDLGALVLSLSALGAGVAFRWGWP